MFDGQLLISKGTGANAYSILGPWMPRRGDNLTVTAEIEATSVASGNILNASTAGPHSEEWDGTLKDMVRYKYTFIPDAAGDWMAFRILPPVWFDGV